jgi:branched-chain amino acid transport system ATP-binding protein
MSGPVNGAMRGLGAAPAAIEVRDLTRRFGGLCAVDSVSIRVETGARHAVIGSNGAGKSTLFALIAGAQRPSSGSVELGGVDVTALAEHRRARRGLARTFQHANLFGPATVSANVALAVRRWLGCGYRPWPDRRREAAVGSRVAQLLETAGLTGRAGVPAASLSHGERRQLEVAVALAAQPSVLLFDEPTAGMSANETRRFVELVCALPPTLTVVLVEHDLEVVFGLATHLSVLHLGRLLADGNPEEVRADPAVRAAYLDARSLA